jgi:hypothetical protein
MAQVYLVTVKCAKNPDHNPSDKKTGPCPFGGLACTDRTGEHHTFATVSVQAAAEVRDLWNERGKLGTTDQRFRVTRVEEAKWLES